MKQISLLFFWVILIAQQAMSAESDKVLSLNKNSYSATTQNTQSKEHPKNPHWLNQMRQRLKLDDKQTQQILQIHENARAERKALREKFEKNIDGVLTEKQRQMREEFRQQREYEANSDSNGGIIQPISPHFRRHGMKKPSSHCYATGENAKPEP